MSRSSHKRRGGENDEEHIFLPTSPVQNMNDDHKQGRKNQPTNNNNNNNVGDGDNDNNSSSSHRRRTRSSQQGISHHHQQNRPTSTNKDSNSDEKTSKSRSRSSSGHRRRHRSRSRDSTKIGSNGSKHRGRRSQQGETREERSKRKENERIRGVSNDQQQKDALDVILGNTTSHNNNNDNDNGDDDDFPAEDHSNNNDQRKQSAQEKSVFGIDSPKTATTTSRTTYTSNGPGEDTTPIVPASSLSRAPKPPPPQTPPPERPKTKRVNLTRSVSPLRTDPSIPDSMHQIQQSLSSERWVHDETLRRSNRLMRNSELHNSVPSDLSAFFDACQDEDVDGNLQLSPGLRSYGDFELAVRSRKKTISLNNFFDSSNASGTRRRARKGTSLGGAPSNFASSKVRTGVISPPWPINDGETNGPKKNDENGAIGDEFYVTNSLDFDNADGGADYGGGDDDNYCHDNDDIDNASTTSFDIAPGLPKRQNSSDLEEYAQYNANLDKEAEQDLLEEVEISNVLSTSNITKASIFDGDNNNISNSMNGSNSSLESTPSNANTDSTHRNHKRSATKRLSIKKKLSPMAASDSTTATTSSETPHIVSAPHVPDHNSSNKHNNSISVEMTASTFSPVPKPITSPKTPTTRFRKRTGTAKPSTAYLVPNTTGGIKKKLSGLEASAYIDNPVLPPPAPLEESSPRKSKKKKKKKKDTKQPEKATLLESSNDGDSEDFKAQGYVSPKKRKSVIKLAKSKVSSIFSHEKTPGYGCVNDDSIRLRDDDDFLVASEHSEDQSKNTSIVTTPTGTRQKRPSKSSRRQKSKSPIAGSGRKKSTDYKRSLSFNDVNKLQQQVQQNQKNPEKPPPPPPLQLDVESPGLLEAGVTHNEEKNDDAIDNKAKSSRRRRRHGSGDEERKDVGGDKDEFTTKLKNDETRRSSGRSESRSRQRSRSRHQDKSGKSRNQSRSKTHKSQRGRESSRFDNAEAASLSSKPWSVRKSRSVSPSALAASSRTHRQDTTGTTSSANNRSRSPGAMRGDIARKRQTVNEFRAQRRSRDDRDLDPDSRSSANDASIRSIDGQPKSVASLSSTNVNSPKPRRSRMKVISAETLEITKEPAGSNTERARDEEFDPSNESLSDLAKRVKDKAEKLRTERKHSRGGEDADDNPRSSRSETRRPALPDVYAKSLQW